MKQKEQITDIKKALKSLKRLFKDLNVNNVEYTTEEHRLVAVFNSNLKMYDDNIIARFEIYDNRTALFGFTFDHLEINEQTLRMINNFNENNPYFVAYIDAAKRYLRVVHTVAILHEEDVAEYALTVLNELASDEMVPLLEPLCLLSEGD